MSNKVSNKKTSLQVRKISKKWLILGAILVVLMGGYAVLKIQDNNRKADAKAQVEEIFNNLQVNGEVVYKNIQDEGCVTGDRGWVGTYTSCAYVGNLIVQNDQELKIDLEKVNAQLKNLGWQYAILPSELAEERLVATNKSGVIAYGDPNSRASFDLHYYRPGSDLYEIGNQGYEKNVSLKEPEYIYTFQIRSRYRTSNYPFGWFGR